MKRLFLLLFAAGLAFGLGHIGWNVWHTTRYFEEHGREATLVIGERYSTARWSQPIPFKRIHLYTARLEPDHEVVIETDQELAPNSTIPIRFLSRDAAEQIDRFSLRPVANTVRLRSDADGAPVRVEATNAFDRLIGRAMGPPAPGVHVASRPNVREAAPARDKPSVPFLITPPGAGTWSLLWQNSRALEWIAFGFGVMAVQSLLGAAWARQKAAMKKSSRDADFVHPADRRIDAAPPPEASKKLSYVPKPDEEIVLPESEKRKMAEARSAAALAMQDERASRAPAPGNVAAEAASSGPSLSLRGARPPAAPAPAPAANSGPEPVSSRPPPMPPPMPSSASGEAAAVDGAPPGREADLEEASAVSAPTSSPLEPGDRGGRVEELPSLAANETAPPMPIAGAEPALKLRRKRSPGGSGENGSG